MEIESNSAGIFNSDPFAQWLAIKVAASTEGSYKVSMTVRSEMLNGLGIAHGGILFSLADSCFGLAANSRNQKAVSIQASINFLKTAKAGELLFAEAIELHNGRTTAVYEITLSNAQQQLLAVYRGTCLKLEHTV